MLVTRHPNNPLISPKDVKPSASDMKVECTFNAGVIEFENQIIMIVRVAESVITEDANTVTVPLLEPTLDLNHYALVKKSFQKDDPDFDFSDSRMIASKSDPGQKFLTSLSHLRLARSLDGVNFVVDDQPFLFPETKYEAFGCEDARCIKIEDTYYINYSAVSGLGITTALATTLDFKTVVRKGIIFCPDNRDVCFFPEKINHKYYALHRPAPKHLGRAEMWISSSPDMINWGEHEHLMGSSDDEWDRLKIGGGAPVLKTDKGWLQIYHGVDKNQRYCLGAMLMSLENPLNIIAKSSVPLIEPTADYEMIGFFGNVVFSCGAIIQHDRLHIYYGAADEVMAKAEISLEALWQHLAI